MQEPVILFPIAPDEFYHQIRAMMEQVVDERILQKTVIPEELAGKTLLVPKEVCQILRISKPTLYELIKQGKLVGFRIQKRRYFARTDIEKIIQKQRVL